MGEDTESCILSVLRQPVVAVGWRVGRHPNRKQRCEMGDKSPKASDKKKKQATAKKETSAKKK